MRITVIISAACMLVPAAGVAQTNDGDQRQACMGDAFKFCASQIPDREQVRQCLTSNHDQISSACRTLIDAGRADRGRKRG